MTNMRYVVPKINIQYIVDYDDRGDHNDDDDDDDERAAGCNGGRLVSSSSEAS